MTTRRIPAFRANKDAAQRNYARPPSGLHSGNAVPHRLGFDLARAELDWTPTIHLEEGLRRTIAYFDNFLRGGPNGD